MAVSTLFFDPAGRPCFSAASSPLLHKLRELSHMSILIKIALAERILSLCSSYYGFYDCHKNYINFDAIFFFMFLLAIPL